MQQDLTSGSYRFVDARGGLIYLGPPQPAMHWLPAASVAFLYIHFSVESLPHSYLAYAKLLCSHFSAIFSGTAYHRRLLHRSTGRHRGLLHVNTERDASDEDSMQLRRSFIAAPAKSVPFPSRLQRPGGAPMQPRRHCIATPATLHRNTGYPGDVA